MLLAFILGGFCANKDYILRVGTSVRVRLLTRGRFGALHAHGIRNVSVLRHVAVSKRGLSRLANKICTVVRDVLKSASLVSYVLDTCNRDTTDQHTSNLDTCTGRGSGTSARIRNGQTAARRCHVSSCELQLLVVVLVLVYCTSSSTSTSTTRRASTSSTTTAHRL